jgi:hypothetical protein
MNFEYTVDYSEVTFSSISSEPHMANRSTAESHPHVTSI